MLELSMKVKETSEFAYTISKNVWLLERTYANGRTYALA